MEINDRSKIVSWLQSPRDYDEGVALYNQYGYNKMLKSRFATGNTAFTRQLLTDELRRLAGLSESQLATLPRQARKVVASEQPAKPADPEMVRALAAADETVSKFERFRERFPFLSNPDCPDDMKILANDMLTAYGRMKEARKRLTQLPDSSIAEAAAAASETIEYFLTDRQILAELEYYRDNGRILGECEYFRRRKAQLEFEQMSDLDLRAQLANARSNVSKWRGKIKKMEAAGQDTAAAADSLRQWSERADAIELTIESRKKK